MEPRRITVDEAKAKWDRGEAVLLDTRSDEAWSKSDATIPGAIRVPPDEVDQRLDDIPRDREVVTFCT